MSKLAIFLLIIIFIGVISLVFFLIYGKLAYLFDKINFADKAVNEEIEKKIKCLIKINNQAKKTLRAKKDYLQEINELSDKDIDSQEKDKILSNYNITVNNLISDYTKLANNKEMKKCIANLLEIDEKLDASKSYYNKNTEKLSEISVKFPANIIAKIMKIKIKPLYDTNEDIKKGTEEL